MASKQKAGNAELIAIFRLEFYKKQRNWKFCKDVCKDPDEVPTKLDPEPPPEPEAPSATNCQKPCLNETYNIDTEDAYGVDWDTITSPLDNAFVENNSDNIHSTFPPYLEDTSSITCLDIDNSPVRRRYISQEWDNLEFVKPEVLVSPADGVCEPGCGEWTDQGWQDYGGEELYQPAEIGVPWELNRDWPARGGDECDGLWQSASLADPEGCSTEDWPSLVADSTSASQFIRGAAAAPHSSEIDLSNRNEPSELHIPQAPAQNKQHEAKSTLLQQLLQEARAGQRPISSMGLDHRTPPHNQSCDVYPTRDRDLNQLLTTYNNYIPPDPYRPHKPGVYEHPNKNTTVKPNCLCTTQMKNTNNMVNYDHPSKKYSNTDFRLKEIPIDPFLVTNVQPSGCRVYQSYEPHSYKDQLVAGSFVRLPEGGRGRGRLAKETVIKIGMGRPYRL